MNTVKIALLFVFVATSQITAVNPHDDFFAAVKEGNKNRVKVLLAEGADVNWVDRHGRTVLHWAALLGNEKVAKHLLKRKANPNAQDNKGWTPLHWAAYECDIDMAELLVRYGAKSGKSDNEGNKPHYIANQSKCSLELQTFLLARRAEDGTVSAIGKVWNWMWGKGNE